MTKDELKQMAVDVLRTVKAATARSEQMSRHYGPAACRADQLACILAALQRAQRAPWQPIETAPKDGSWILVRATSGYVNRPYFAAVACWEYDFRPHDPWQTSECQGFSEWGLTPTHWMPLPALPSVEEAPRDGE